MAGTVKKTKAEIIAEQVAETVGAGKEQHLETVDFNDPDRPKTCLEVDFPILPINQIAQIEGNAGKPIYQMSKWWARRRSSVFRSTLLAAATKAPDDPAEAAKTVWETYYGNHQKNEAFKNLKVADIFMGGGTTLVEGARLGMQMTGNDLNPVAWMVVKNELADVNLDEVNKLFDHVENEVKSQIMPFYACEGPGGDKGIWTQKSTGEIMGDDFDPLSLTPEERKDFSYEGPEIIYTFWAKHGPCSAPDCGHRTPLMSSPVVAIKTLSVKAWQNISCNHCHQTFDIETSDARMAPDIPLVVTETEKPFSVIDSSGRYTCPHCHQEYIDESAGLKGNSIQLPSKNKKNKKIALSLVIHPNWLKGAPGKDGKLEYGGTNASDCVSTIQWHDIRSSSLKLIEVRGELPSQIICPDTGISIDTKTGTVPKDAHFVCQSDTCGREQKTLPSIQETKTSAPTAPFLNQGYSKKLSDAGAAYGGKFFSPINNNEIKKLNAAFNEWNERRKSDLEPYWPKSEIPYGLKAHIKDPLPKHGYTHWHMLFNARQLLLHTLILKTIDEAYGFNDSTKLICLGAFQQYLAYQNMFSFWHRSKDHFAPFLSNNNLNQKNVSVEVGAFVDTGYGPWRSTKLPTIKALEWKNRPWELVPTAELVDQSPEFAASISGKSVKVFPHDKILPPEMLSCSSSTELDKIPDGSIDLVVTDPPFSGLFQYAEFSDFFYVWLRLVLKGKHPEIFGAEFTPKALEAVSNTARNPDDADEFYKKILTQCWREAARILKPAGILSFTFHHSEDDPWVDVLESLFDAGFYLEVTYPIRSDETKGDKAQFGSQKIEYDIIHVCRKHSKAPAKISWPRLRRQILSDVKQLQSILEHHQNAGLPKADIQVIKRGKALEYFSRHYGQVYVEEGREFTVKEALVGINQLLDDQDEGEAGGTPINCEPISRQFLRIFASSSEVKRDQIQKYLRGTGIGPSDFINRGWTAEKKKIFYWLSPLEFAKERAEKLKSISRDMDQAMILVGACYENSGIEVKKLLNNEFKPHPALGDLLQWLCSHGADKEMRQNAITAKQLYSSWAASNQQIVKAQLALFDMEDEA